MDKQIHSNVEPKVSAALQAVMALPNIMWVYDILTVFLSSVRNVNCYITSFTVLQCVNLNLVHIYVCYNVERTLK